MEKSKFNIEVLDKRESVLGNEGIKINWGAFGSVSIDEAKIFAIELNNAITSAEKLEKCSMTPEEIADRVETVSWQVAQRIGRGKYDDILYRLEEELKELYEHDPIAYKKGYERNYKYAI